MGSESRLYRHGPVSTSAPGGTPLLLTQSAKKPLHSILVEYAGIEALKKPLQGTASSGQRHRWSRDLNPGPQTPQSSALPNELLLRRNHRHHFG